MPNRLVRERLHHTRPRNRCGELRDEIGLCRPLQNTAVQTRHEPGALWPDFERGERARRVVARRRHRPRMPWPGDVESPAAKGALESIDGIEITGEYGLRRAV